MPQWDSEKGYYVEESCVQSQITPDGVILSLEMIREQRQERFRTALLNEMNEIRAELTTIADVITRRLPDPHSG